MRYIPAPATKWDEIVPGLFQGGHDYRSPDLRVFDTDVIVADEFDMVFSFYSRPGYGPADGVEHHVFRMPDTMLTGGVLDDSTIAAVRGLADQSAIAVRNGRRVLHRCQAGYNRSGLLTAFVLIRFGFTAAAAIDLIRARRSRYALCNDYFVTLVYTEEIRHNRELAEAS